MVRIFKIGLKNVRFLFLLLPMCVVFGQQTVPKKVVVIDVGHGGKDSGAIGINGVMEKDVVLAIAKEIIRLNKTVLDTKFDIYLTRYTDTLISLADRSRLAKSLKADVFVSLHCNAASWKSRGMEVYVARYGDSSKVKGAIALGMAILKEGHKNLGFVSRGVKFADFQVLRETIGACPSVLVELGFLTDGVEGAYFLEEGNLKRLGLMVLMGVVRYYKLKF